MDSETGCRGIWEVETMVDETVPAASHIDSRLKSPPGRTSLDI